MDDHFLWWSKIDLWNERDSLVLVPTLASKERVNLQFLDAAELAGIPISFFIKLNFQLTNCKKQLNEMSNDRQQKVT